ncbi:hypothetical protein JZO67_004972 [Enterococcus sp. 665A]|uniref:Uncharacterized protein n=1 Tax=Candidatus Enterococcus ferrettii TaxID=2815324 RepID=A0ABV0EZD0_9ENTE
MLIPKPPKETLVDSMVYRSYKGQGDDYNKPEYEDDQQVNYIRMDRNPSYTFGTQGNSCCLMLLYFATTG